MKTGSLFIAVFSLLSLLFSCAYRDDSVYLLSQRKALLLPVEASSLFGYFLKEGLKVNGEYTEGEVIKFLNFPYYKVVIADSKTVKKLSKISDNWIPLCLVALKGDEKYFLVVKRELFEKPSTLIKLVKGWNYGVILLKDPAVVYYLTGRRELTGFKFLSCEGGNEGR